MAVAGLIASIYAALSLLLAPLTFGTVQFRVAEAMTLLPILFPEAIPGLFVGCFLTNLFSPVGLPDIVFGSLATLIAAYMTFKLRRNTWLACVPPIAVNALVVGMLLHVEYGTPFILNMLSVGAGQAGAVLVLGSALIYTVKRSAGDLRMKN
jgi:uncharacterized membrane protein